MDRILEHIEKKGAKWTKAHPPLKKGYLHNFTTPGKTRADEDKYTLSLIEKHGIQNVRGGKWCMVEMKPHTVREIEALIGKKVKPKPETKPKPKTKPKTKAKKKWSHSSYKKDRYGQLVPKTADDYRRERENR